MTLSKRRKKSPKNTTGLSPCPPSSKPSDQKKGVNRTTDIKLTEIDGFQITVSEYGTFYAVKGDVKYDAKNMDDLKEVLKRHKSEVRRFKPIDVIHLDSEMTGRVTSRVADNDVEVYFTYKDPSYEKKVRKAIRVENYGWGSDPLKHNFVLDTEANRAILAEIWKKEAERKQIGKDITRLKTTFADPLTWDVINKAGGE